MTAQEYLNQGGTDPQQYLKLGGALRNGMIPQQEIPNVNPNPAYNYGAPITGESLTPSTSLDFVQPSTTPASAVTLPEKPAPLGTEQTKESDLSKQIQRLQAEIGGVGELVGKEELEIEKRKEFGVEARIATQESIYKQLLNLKAQTENIPAILQAESEGRGRTAGGIEPIQTGRLRQAGIQATILNAQYSAATGDLATAERQVKQAVSDAFAGKESELDALTKNLARIKDSPEFTNEQRARAQAQANKVKSEQDKMEAAKKIVEEIIKLSTKVVSSEIQNNENSLTANAITDLISGDAGLVATTDTLIQAQQLAAPYLQKEIKPIKLDTQVVEIGGRKVLINTQTGQTIRDLGGQESGGGTLIEENRQQILQSNLPNQEKNNVILTDILKAKVGQGTRTKIADILGVINAAEDLAMANQSGSFIGVSPLRTLLDVKIPFTDIGLVPFRQALKQKGTATTEGYLEAINLKVQQWASGAALTTAQTEQVGRFTPKVTDTDTKVKEKLNNLVNFMLTQAKSQLQSEGINFQPQKVDLFEAQDLLKKASPEQIKQLKEAGLL